MSNAWLIFFIVAVAVASIVAAIRSKSIGDWSALIRQYPAPPGERERGQILMSASVGVSNYKNTLYLNAQPEGLYLSPAFLVIKLGTPALIPWSAFTSMTQGVFYDRLRVAGTPPVVLRLPASVVSTFQAHLPQPGPRLV